MTTTKVYADSLGSRTRYPETDGHYLQTMFEGTRAECEAYVKKRTRNNQPTHFLTLSTLDHDAATKRILG